MSYDVYAELGGKSEQDVGDLIKGQARSQNISNIAARVRLLAGIAARNEQIKDYAVSGDRKQGGGYKSLVHASDGRHTAYAKELIAPALVQLRNLGLLDGAPDLQQLPLGSWFLQFIFTLAKPWMSKDDDPFYVAESVNPVRKDKVFKVPLMSAASWKGLLRWTAMQTRLVETRAEWNDEQWTEERLRQTFLFGDEKGEEPGGAKDFTAHLDKLGGPAARKRYAQKTRDYFFLDEKDALPHHGGRLMFYPTFFDLIDVEVINPHSRKTKAGTHPIYLECVPAGARGAFSLLYVPFDLIGQDADEIRAQAAQDLATLCEAMEALLLTYGFSAKRTSGYGTAKDEIENGIVRTRAGEWKLTRLSNLAAEVEHVGF
jgi:CRISPR-associated protein Cmr2